MEIESLIKFYDENLCNGTMENINPINYILIDVLKSVNGMYIQPKNNYRMFDGYYLDIERPKKTQYRFRIRGDFLRDICNLSFDKKRVIIKFSTDFYICVNDYSFEKITTNLFDGTFNLNNIEETFINNNVHTNIDYDSFRNMLVLCRKIYNEIDFSR